MSFGNARYSVPHTLAGRQVWVRAAAGKVVIVAGEGTGAVEVARHPEVGAGQTSIIDDHYPDRSGRDPLQRTPRPTKPSEADFLALGEGAKLYLVEAGACGARRIEVRMAEAVALAALHGSGVVDHALGTAAMAGRFAEGDLESIIVHGLSARPSAGPPPEHSLAAGTAMWSALPTEAEEDER